MKNLKSLLFMGFLIWLVPFLISFLIFPLRSSDRYFFETIMSLILIFSTCFILTKYHHQNPIDSAHEGLVVGIIWLAINLALDFFVFIIGPLAMPPISYLKEIGLDYMVIPLVTITLGVVRKSYDIKKDQSI